MNDGNNIFDISLQRNKKEIQQCMKMSKKIDKIIIDSINKEIEPKLVAGVVADALGRFLEKFNNKENLWKVLENTIKRKASIE